ncbi:MAG: energy-coupling factor transporter transmembrane protein EcfT [Treponema sp.]|nr:energy-coupling factor transporter transmembrane protein EcfT [Treponema sp.]
MEESYFERYCKYHKYNNWLCDLYPLTKLNILLIFALSPLLVQNYLYGICLCALYYLMALCSGRLKYFNGIFWKLFITLGLFIIVVRQITVKGEIGLFSLFGWIWTREALDIGFNLAFVILDISGGIILFYAITPMRDLMYALELRGMSHETSFIMLSSFQCVIDLKKNCQVILDSQKARGIETEGNILVRVKALIPVLGPLLLSAISSTEEKTISMDARAFSVNRRHTFLREIEPPKKFEKILLVFVNGAFALLIVYRIYLFITLKMEV